MQAAFASAGLLDILPCNNSCGAIRPQDQLLPAMRRLYALEGATSPKVSPIICLFWRCGIVS